MTTTYVTVAIPYVNSDPHLGYAYELVQADVYARVRRRAGDQVRFLGGTDDFSLKNVLAAEQAGVDTRTFVDAHAQRFEALAGPLDLSFDDFIRTSADPRHEPAVRRLWELAEANGDLYQKSYDGDYCVGCEQFYEAAELADGLCPEHRTAVERVSETNWFFRLSAYQQYLDDLISSDRLVIRPEPFRKEILAFIRRGLDDISVSRTVARARGWGIGVPGDPTQVIYVWFDALANYISALGFGDPDSPDYQDWWVNADDRVHVIGKGILRFHAVYWPAFLASAGQPAPTRLQVHPYLTVNGSKISKSAGVTIDPVTLAAEYGSDSLRWWFTRDVNPVVDTDFTTSRLIARTNEDLASGLGNVVNRIVTLAHRYRDGRIPVPSTAAIPETRDLGTIVTDALTEFDHRRASAAIVDAIAALNRDLETTEPWKLAKDPDQADRFDQVLSRQYQTAVTIGQAIRPIAPHLAVLVAAQLDLTAGALPPAAPLCARIDP